MRSDYEPRLGDSPNELRVVRKYQVRDLVGKLLTYVDATYSDKEQRQAHKDLVRHHVYRWFDVECDLPDLQRAVKEVVDEIYKPQDDPHATE